ncbi:MAG: hypothetical protein Q8908_05235 [Bacteroidota bacterium]|nr:hypothetical protein [Bacteroidota bacterium]
MFIAFSAHCPLPDIGIKLARVIKRRRTTEFNCIFSNLFRKAILKTDDLGGIESCFIHFEEQVVFADYLSSNMSSIGVS